MRAAWRIDLQIAWENLVQHRRRNLFLGGALAAVTWLFVLMMGLTAGVRETMIRSATTLETGHVNVGGFYKITSGMSAPLVTQYAKVLDLVRKAVPEADRVIVRDRGWATVVSDTARSMAGLMGVDIDREPGLREILKMEAGSMDGLRQPGTLMVFHSQAEKLGLKVGDTVTLSAPTSRGVNNVIDLRVVAIAHDLGLMSQFDMYMPAKAIHDLYQYTPEATSVIMLHLKDMRAIQAVAARLRDGLAKAGYRIMDHDPSPFWMKFDKVNREAWTGQKLDITTWDDEVSFLTWVLTALDFITAVLIVILLVIVVVGIMNVMWIAIRERTREIGTLRAIGMPRGQVRRMFLLESTLLGLVATSLGALAAVVTALLVNAARIPVPLAMQLFLMSDHVVLAVHAIALIKAVGGITLVAALAALYPSNRAAKLKPITAMGHAG